MEKWTQTFRSALTNVLRTLGTKSHSDLYYVEVAKAAVSTEFFRILLHSTSVVACLPQGIMGTPRPIR